MDIIITLPKNIKWEDYQKELDLVQDGTGVLNFKVAHFPKSSIGDRCYLLHQGYIVGWMQIVGFEEKNFTCTVTGRRWSGKFILRSGKFNEIDPVQMKGFQGFRYKDRL